MRDQICVVTGANAGLGADIARCFALQGASVVLVCRDEQRGQTALAGISKQTGNSHLYLELADLASLTQVRELAGRLSTQFPTLHVLVNNAGVYRSQLEMSEDGFEMTMAVNHLAPFVLTNTLLPQLRAGKGKVINVSSRAHRKSELNRQSIAATLRGHGQYRPFRAYADSKLANILFTTMLAQQQAHDISVAAVHPGVLATRIWNQNKDPRSLLVSLLKPFMGRAEDGSAAVLAALGQLPEQTGQYFHKTESALPEPLGRDQGLVEQLWSVSAELSAD